ncbi:MAG: hypothetical protein ACR2MB_11755 [Acidimicrobiales bacterium]
MATKAEAPAGDPVAAGDCLEARLGAALRALAGLRLPAEACLQVMLVAHVVWALRGAHGKWWVAPIAGVAAVLWLVAGVVLSRRLLPTIIRTGLEFPAKVVSAFLAFDVPRRGIVLVALSTVLTAGAVAPWWPGLVLCIALLLLAAMWRENARQGLLVVGIGCAVGAVVVGALAAFEQHEWIGRLLGALLGSCLMLLLVVRRLRLLRFAIPLAIALAAGTDRFGAAAGVVLMTGLLLYPAALLVAAVLRYRVVADRIQAIVDEKGLRDSVGRWPSGPREDEVRESDGYYRVCYPTFRHWSGEAAGESGYVTTFGGPHDSRVPLESVLLRTLTTQNMPLVHNRDLKGKALAAMALSGLQALQVEGMDDTRLSLSQGWTVSRSRPQDDALAKMPWDHPYVMAIPISWPGQFRYPAGSGIHDEDGYPCLARSVTVRIALKSNVLASFGNLALNGQNATSDSDTRVCQEVLWNAPRILPGFYETLLMRLVAEFRKESIALFLEHESAREAHREVKEGLLGRLRVALSAALPPPLNDLVDFSLLDIEMHTSVAGDVLERIDQLRNKEDNRPFEKIRHVEVVLRRTRAWAIDPYESVVAGSNEVNVPLTVLVNEARHRISEAANQAVNDVVQSLSGGFHANALPDVQRSVDQRMGEFHEDIDRHFSRIQHALNGLTAVTRQVVSTPARKE